MIFAVILFTELAFARYSDKKLRIGKLSLTRVADESRVESPYAGYLVEATKGTFEQTSLCACTIDTKDPNCINTGDVCIEIYNPCAVKYKN